MPVKAYLRLVAEKLDVLKGSNRIDSKEGFMEIFAVNHQLVSPRDAASGAASGKRQHKSFVFIKATDASSPRFYELLVKNLEVKEAEVHFFQEAVSGRLMGAQKSFYKIVMRKGAVADIRLNMQDGREANETLPLLSETVALVYQFIEWEWVAGKVMAVDSLGNNT